MQCTLEPVPKWYIYAARIRAALDEDHGSTLDGRDASILFSSTALFDAAGIVPSVLILGGNGMKMFNLMELNQYEIDDCFIEIERFLLGLDNK